MDDETNDQLLNRYRHVQDLLQTNKRQLERMKPGGAKDRKSRWGGCLGFTLLTIQSKIEERGLQTPT